jgi:hypothetical protein
MRTSSTSSAEAEGRHPQSIDGTPGLLDRLTTVHLTVQTLQGDLDRLVQELRAAGATWASIGNAVGISAQAAHQRWSIDGNAKHKIRQRQRRATEPSKGEAGNGRSGRA